MKNSAYLSAIELILRQQLHESYWIVRLHFDLLALGRLQTTICVYLYELTTYYRWQTRSTYGDQTTHRMET